MKELKELWSTIKEDPKEFVGSLITILVIFGLFYACILLDSIVMKVV